MRSSEDGASTAPPCYAACNAPASRSDGALPTHCTSALGTHPVAAALKRALPCERLVSGSTPNKITSCLRTSRSCCSLFRLRKSFRRAQRRSIKLFVTSVPRPPAPWRRPREHSLAQAPHFYRASFALHSFCQGIAPKNFWAVHNKFFAPLTTTENSIINTRAERSPAPRLNCANTLRC